MQRCLWLHLLRVEINLLTVSKAINLAVLGTELFHGFLYLALGFLLFFNGSLYLLVLAPFQISVLRHFYINEFCLWKFFLQLSLLLHESVLSLLAYTSCLLNGDRNAKLGKLSYLIRGKCVPRNCKVCAFKLFCNLLGHLRVWHYSYSFSPS